MDITTLGAAVAMAKKVMPQVTSADAGKLATVDSNGKWVAADLEVGQGEVAVDSTLLVSGAAADAKVAGDKVNELKSALDSVEIIISSKNLLNYNTILEGKALDYNSAHATYAQPIDDNLAITTDYIPVTAGKTYYSTKAGTSYERDKMLISRYAFYSSNKALVSYENGSTSGIVTAPENAAYYRVTLRDITTGWTKQRAIDAKWMIYEFDPLYYYGLPFESYSKSTCVDCSVIDTKINLSNLFCISKNKNMLIYNNIINYIILKTTDGTVNANSTGCTSDFIEAKANTAYFISNINTSTGIRKRNVAQEICFYDSDKTFISSTTNAYTFTTPANTKYFRLSWHVTAGETASSIASQLFMVEEGSYYSMYVSPDGRYRIDPTLFDSETRETLSNAKYAFGLRKSKQPAKRLMSVAHRGVISGIPSNTVPAFEYAAQNGCDYIEFDIRKTADDKYVIFHDKQITISGVTKDVLEFNLDEIKTYRFSSYSGTAYEDTEIPTLEEALQCLVKNNAFACVELKNSSSELSESDIEDIYDIFAEYGMEYTTLFTSDTPSHKEYLLNINPYLMVSVNFKNASGITVSDAANDIRSLYNGKNTIVCALPVELITSSNIETLKAAGADFFLVGAGLGGSIELPDDKLKYVHYLMKELTVS